MLRTMLLTAGCAAFLTILSSSQAYGYGGAHGGHTTVSPSGGANYNRGGNYNRSGGNYNRSGEGSGEGQNREGGNYNRGEAQGQNRAGENSRPNTASGQNQNRVAPSGQNQNRPGENYRPNTTTGQNQNRVAPGTTPSTTNQPATGNTVNVSGPTYNQSATMNRAGAYGGGNYNRYGYGGYGGYPGYGGAVGASATSVYSPTVYNNYSSAGTPNVGAIPAVINYAASQQQQPPQQQPPQQQ